jgi:hypothetical protein
VRTDGGRRKVGRLCRGVGFPQRRRGAGGCAGVGSWILDFEVAWGMGGGLLERTQRSGESACNDNVKLFSRSQCGAAGIFGRRGRACALLFGAGGEILPA